MFNKFDECYGAIIPFEEGIHKSIWNNLNDKVLSTALFNDQAGV